MTGAIDAAKDGGAGEFAAAGLLDDELIGGREGGAIGALQIDSEEDLFAEDAHGVR